MGRVMYKERKMVKLARFINGWFKIFPIAFFILIGVGNYALLFFSLSILSSIVWILTHKWAERIDTSTPGMDYFWHLFDKAQSILEEQQDTV